MKLQHKTVLFISPLIIIPIMIISALAFYKLKEMAEERFNTQVTTLLDQISQHINEKIKVSEANLHLLSDHQLVKKYVLTNDESVRYQLLLPHLLSVFENIQSSMSDYYEIRIILPNGYEDARWATSGILNNSEDVKDEKFFHELKKTKKIQFKKIIYDESIQQYSLLLVNKLLLNDPSVDTYGVPPKIRGYLAITTSLEYLRNEINKNTIGKAGFISVVNNQGEIIISPDHQSIVLSDELLKQNVQKILNNQKEDLDSLGFEVNNMSLLLHSRKLSSGLTLIGILPEKEIFNSGLELGQKILIVSLIAILFIVLTVLLAFRHLILKPIGVLNEATKSVGSGKFDLDIAIKRNDEIGSLSDAFIEMSKNLKQTHEDVSFTASHDSLTGLPNRGMFQAHLSDILKIAKQKDTNGALLFLDLDNFKNVNDTLGHQAGDDLLKVVALRLSGVLRTSESISIKNRGKSRDMVARLGGDEFVILLDEIDGPQEASVVAERVLQKLGTPVDILGNQTYTNCSIGITLYPDDAKDFSELIKYADIAMYYAKSHGKNHYQFYSQELNANLQNRLVINSRIQAALDQNLFYLNYQPKMDVITGEIVGLEALIRWNDSVLGVMTPDEFIPIAEESGLITPITKWVFDEVCRHCVAWKKDGLEIVAVSVNVSNVQFKKRDLINMVNSSLEKTGLLPEFIEIELTETSLISNMVDAVEVLDGLNDLNIKIALDDFGTGYSSLSYLNELPIHTLKIDRDFIKTIVDGAKEYAIVDAIIALAHALDLKVVAEGVETDSQLQYLKERGCDQVQGYLISKPMSSVDIFQYIKSDAGNI